MDSIGFQVAFDGQYLQQPTTGTGQYSLQLWRALSARPDAGCLVLIQPDRRVPPRAALVPGRPLRVESVSGPAWMRGRLRKVWWEQRGLSLGTRHGAIDLLHIPTFAGPRFGRLPFVMTIHDMIPSIFPEYGNSTAMRVYRTIVTGAAKRARLIITDSDFSRSDIIRILGISPDRIRVIPLAAGPEMRPGTNPDAENALRARWGLNGPVVINFDGLDVRKNVRSLIEGFGRAL
ncbi:MAG TPA: glycosyltransferase, partial [Thermomicrobiaceae bacterium]|nr:glycosyltransferase [Thermomicrobiaceae bacterium]